MLRIARRTLFLLMPAFGATAAAQSSHSVRVSVHALGQGVPAARVNARSTGASLVDTVTDLTGDVQLMLADGAWVIAASKAGLRTDSLNLSVSSDTAVTFDLIPAGVATLSPVIVGTSRVARRIEDEPERVEVLTGEDVDEKTVTRPADATRLLSEIPGIQVQATSPSLGGAGLRLRGLRSRYTLVLSDGLPLFGSVQGLGFLDIPPLDVAQAEIIKGAAAALYGPQAIGGVVDLISRRPPRTGRITDAVANATSRNGQDLSAWTGGALDNRWGYTVLAGGHRQTATDVNHDGWADIPGYRRGEARLRITRSDTTLTNFSATAAVSHEQREGGTLASPAGAFGFRTIARTTHGDAGATMKVPVSSRSAVTVRAAIGTQWQKRAYGDSAEDDQRTSSLGEVVYSALRPAHDFVLGTAASGLALSGHRTPFATYNFNTLSAFAQDTYTPVPSFSLSATARLDRNSRYGTFVSPRISALGRLGAGWTLRGAAGLGTSNPTSLVEEADEVGLSRVRGFSMIQPERLREISSDLNGKLGPAELNLSVFASSLSQAVRVLENEPLPGAIEIANTPSPSRVKGAEFYLVYTRDPIAVTALYSLTDASEWSLENARRVRTPLVPRQTGGLDVAFESDETGTRAGLEIFYTGRQPLEHDPYRSESKPYSTVGVLVEQRVGSLMLFVNGDDLTDVRQTRFDPLLLPRQAPTGRWTTDEWAPLEGRVINFGGRLRF